MPYAGSSDISERLRALVNMRHSADAASMAPSMPELDYAADSMPHITEAAKSPDPDYVNPLTGLPAFQNAPPKRPAPAPRVGQFYGRG